MKFSVIGLALCLLLVIGSTTTTTASPSNPPSYTIATNNNQAIIFWQNKPIYSGKLTTATISPDGQTVAFVIEHQVGFNMGDDPHTPVYGGALFTAHAGGRVMEIQKIKNSRGFGVPEGDLEIGVVYHPERLQWDHTSQYLYFMTLPWPTRYMLWRLKPGTRKPRAVVPLTDYRLLRKKQGLDWVEAYQTDYAPPPVYRDWETTYIYTPEEMAADEYVEPTRKSSIDKDWPQP